MYVVCGCILVWQVTTKAMAEGAIEGSAADYEMPSRFATDFRFSRFGKRAARPRDTSRLQGKRVKNSGVAGSGGQQGAGASADIAPSAAEVEEAEGEAAPDKVASGASAGLYLQKGVVLCNTPSGKQRVSVNGCKANEAVATAAPQPRRLGERGLGWPHLGWLSKFSKLWHAVFG
jgi:hypothetical protein